VNAVEDGRMLVDLLRCGALFMMGFRTDQGRGCHVVADRRGSLLIMLACWWNWPQMVKDFREYH